MSNERITEDIVRKLLKESKYTFDRGFIVEEQISVDPTIRRLLSKASKYSSKQPGYPEFIISKMDDNNTVIIIECKANISQHISKGKTLKPKDYAVDGILHYASFLNSEYDVIAIAVRGTTKKDLVIDSFLLRKNDSFPVFLCTGNILTYNEYLNKYN